MPGAPVPAPPSREAPWSAARSAALDRGRTSSASALRQLDLLTSFTPSGDTGSDPKRRCAPHSKALRAKKVGISVCATLFGALHCAPRVLFALIVVSAASIAASAAQLPSPDSRDGATPEPPAAESMAVHPWIRPLASAAHGAPEAAVQDPDDEGWQISVAPYAFLSGLDGQLRAGDRSVDVDSSSGDITEVLKFAFAFRVEAQHERWGFAFDNNYVKLGDDVTTDRALVPDVRYDLTMNVTEVEPRYRLWSGGDQDEPVGGPKAAVDVIGGVRFVHFETDLLLRRLLAADEARSGSSTYVHAYVGNRFVWSPWKYATLEGRYNIALASDFSWFVNVNADIRPWEHFSLGGGLQALDLSLENDSSETALDARLTGPVLFLKVHF
jgi:hypothetical protein